ncbi:hypothetical protein D9619_004141 [Psilocybe cf. subviscida]|uniref:Hydrophobin n=1 Tax=Psilocybe cf. subviscida TaxID=2480587 RepID=A0A8H5BQ62_9AGAR|nr:hypothetical protein D9619_004141 [Psilocybe cf. subviscida]
MQLKLAALATVAVTTLAAAIPSPSNQCNTGSLECCQSVQTGQSVSSGSLATLIFILGIKEQDLTGLVGVTCSPISVIGAVETSCSAQSVCCTNNSFNGVLALGCTPVNTNL